jgi:hypothetical protein
MVMDVCRQIALVSLCAFLPGCSRGGATGGEATDLAPPLDMAGAGPAADLGGASGFQEFRLAEPVKINVDRSPRSVLIRDVNRDGRADVLVGGTGFSTVIPYLNQGGFAFQPPMGGGTAVADAYPISLSGADFNRDGLLDIAVATFTGKTVNVFPGDGTGKWGARRTLMVGQNSNHVAAADLDGDGNMDVVSVAVSASMGRAVHVFYGRGNGDFDAPAQPQGPDSAASVAVADLNGDGRLDLVTASYSGDSYTVLLAAGARTFAPPRSDVASSRPRVVRALDLDRDGKADLAISLERPAGQVGVFLGKGDGSFRPQRNYAVGAGPYGLGAADLNADGRVDLYTANIDGGSVSVLLGRGDGTFAEARSFLCGEYTVEIDSGDLDGDGRIDLAAVNQIS